jgi:hypothetical protein
MTSKDDLKNKGIEVSNCLLDQSTFTVIGVLGGLAVFYKTRNKRHFFAAAGGGTISDVFVGYYGTCRPLIAEYLAVKADHESRNPIDTNPK